MLQRLGLAQALMHDPELLILDEPTDGVDPVGRADMRDVLKRLKEDGKTIFINSHLLQEVELTCDRVAILDRGKVLREGTIAELTARPQTEHVFELCAPEPAIRGALDEGRLIALASLAPDRHRATVYAADQAALDRCIDDLRRAGVGIISLGRSQQTLEQAFLQIVEASQPTDELVLVDVARRGEP
jgi:ABC-2 type transport system ATP-binding protein